MRPYPREATRALILCIGLWGGTHAVSSAEGIQPRAILAQNTVSPVRLDDLEALVRELNGRIEDLTLEIELLKDELMRSQEDAEFRFAAIEDALCKDGPACTPLPPAKTGKKDK